MAFSALSFLEIGCFKEEEKYISQAEVHPSWLVVEMDLK